MCCEFCVCGQNSVRWDHSNGTSLNGNICFGSLSSLQKGNLLSVCVGHFGASLLDQTLFRFGSWGKTRAEKGVLLSYVTLVHSLSSQDLFPYDWHYPIARTAKNISLKWNNSLLIRLGTEELRYGSTYQPSLTSSSVYSSPQNMCLLWACRKRHRRALSSRWKERETENNACKKSMPPSLCRVAPEDE